MDENRLFDNNSAYVDNMGALVKRDRNHPSVVIWSFCNENGCEGSHEQGGPAFQAIAQAYDGTRPTLANMFTFNDLLSNTIDVQVRPSHRLLPPPPHGVPTHWHPPISTQSNLTLQSLPDTSK